MSEDLDRKVAMLTVLKTRAEGLASGLESRSPLSRERTPRDGEVSQILCAIQIFLDEALSEGETPSDEVIREIHGRIKHLGANPDSAGAQGEALEQMKRFEKEKGDV